MYVISLLVFPVQVPQAKEWLQHRRQNVRPWLQFVQTANFRVPGSVPRLSRRVVRNVEYFQSNYLFVLLGLSAYCLLTSPLLLLAVAGSLLACHQLSRRQALAGAPLRLLGRELTPLQQYGLVAACSLPLYYVAGAGAALFWTLGASCIVISLHAAFYNIDALIAEPEDAFGLTEHV